jgi:hypothetical protein
VFRRSNAELVLAVKPRFMDMKQMVMNKAIMIVDPRLLLVPGGSEQLEKGRQTLTSDR